MSLKYEPRPTNRPVIAIPALPEGFADENTELEHVTLAFGRYDASNEPLKDNEIKCSIEPNGKRFFWKNKNQ